MPDFFVPVDTALYTDYHRNLVAKGIVLKVTLKYVENHRKELLDKYKTFGDFNDKFVISSSLMDDLVAMGNETKVPLNKEQLKTSEPLLKTQLKALIARDLWDMNEYYHVMNTANESIRKGVEILQSGDYDKKLK
jgi:C-terminal processing peptidase-3. Serine peptidase. MEROPS family S41A